MFSESRRQLRRLAKKPRTDKWSNGIKHIKSAEVLCTYPQTVNAWFRMLAQRIDHWQKNLVCYNLVVVNPNRGQKQAKSYTHDIQRTKVTFLQKTWNDMLPASKLLERFITFLLLLISSQEDLKDAILLFDLAQIWTCPSTAAFTKKRGCSANTSDQTHSSFTWKYTATYLRRNERHLQDSSISQPL